MKYANSFNKMVVSFYFLSLLMNKVFAQDANDAKSTDNSSTVASAPFPLGIDKYDHVELAGVFLSVVWVLVFLIVIFIVLKYFIYLPDEKRKDIE